MALATPAGVGSGEDEHDELHGGGSVVGGPRDGNGHRIQLMGLGSGEEGHDELHGSRSAAGGAL